MTKHKISYNAHLLCELADIIERNTKDPVIIKCVKKMKKHLLPEEVGNMNDIIGIEMYAICEESRSP